MNNIIIGTANSKSISNCNIVSVAIDDNNSFKKLTPSENVYTKYQETIKDLEEIKDDLSRLKAYLLIKDKIEYEFIEKYYYECLKDLYLYGLMQELHNRFGDNIVITSDEETKEFSHRRVFADYYELKNGVFLPELYTDQKGYVKKINPNRYKKTLRDIENSYYY